MTGYDTYMDKYLVTFTFGQPQLFSSYEKALAAADRYQKASGYVACVEQVTAAKLTLTLAQ